MEFCLGSIMQLLSEHAEDYGNGEERFESAKALLQ
jgi:hypothetical protein